MNRWQKLINQPGVIIADGAMGTMLQQAGLEPGDLPMLWNVDHPGRVRAVHRAYLEAGARILLTNTFNGNRFRLAIHGLEGRGDELNQTGAQLLRTEIEDYVKRAGTGTPQAVVAGDIGPTGEILAPLGKLLFEDAADAFARQAVALIAGGADVIWIETMSDLEEVRAAVEGTRRASADIPVIVTMTFDTHGRTMMGVKPETAATTLGEWRVAAMGGNCGNGPDEMLVAISKMRAAAPGAILVAKPNAGMPELVNGATVYRASPELMAQSALQLRDAGARIIGGCCGTTPDHIAAMARAISP
ncbi:MAG: homocysteine S-methyltransferase family protein [Chloroflexi bacterium]|nr:homocysteine S-methyltransferase family protein [Chloroflexota bacterium]